MGEEGRDRRSERASIMLRDFPAARIFFRQILQQNAKHGRLQFIETAVEAGNCAHVTVLPTILAQQPHLLRKARMIGDDSSSIAECAEILRGIKTERGEISPRSSESSAQRCAVRLRAIFNHAQTMRASNRENGRHVRRVPVEMHGNDRPQSWMPRGTSRAFDIRESLPANDSHPS